MADELFELMTKMYSEFSEFRKETREEFKKMETRQTKIELLIENDIKTNISALHDGYKQTYEKLVSVEKKVDNLSGQVEQQEFEIKVFKGGKAGT